MPRQKKTTFIYEGKLTYPSETGNWQIETKKGVFDFGVHLIQFRNKQVKLIIETKKESNDDSNNA